MSKKLHTSFERCCRLCAQEQDVTVSVFSPEAMSLHLQNKLNKYLLIEIEEDDDLPKNICIECCSKLQTVCDFIDVVKKAQEELLQRSTLLDQVKSEPTESEPQEEPDDDKYTQMEINVDPMMVLQNKDLPSPNIPTEDITHLHGVDAENVTIKLIKKAKTNVTEENETVSYAKPFACKPCGRSFYSEIALKNHNWTHISASKLERQYKCSSCSESFHYKHDLVTHLKQHKTGSCQLCGRGFRSERTYLAHLMVHLPSNKAYTCKVCGRSYNSWGSLRTHTVSHSSERPYQCSYCKKRFKRNQDLKFHINQHTGERPYQCPFCERRFASSGNCYSHKNRMHPKKVMEAKMTFKQRDPGQVQPIAPKPSNLVPVKGLFKYQCTLCDSSFMKRDNFTYHMFQHTGEKPFQCSFCASKFVTRRGLQIHHDKLHPTSDRPLGLLSKNVLLK